MKPVRKKQQTQPLIALIGPTAVGKTALVLELAEELKAEVVSVDSMQVYRHLDIGTAKPTPAERARVRHHLIDVAEPDEEYNLSLFIAEAELACRDIGTRHRLTLLSGGTGLYLKGFQEGLFTIDDDDLANGNNSDTDENEIRAGLRRELSEQGRAALYARLREIDPRTADRLHPNDSSRILRGLEIFAVTGRTWSELLEHHHSVRQRKGARREILKIGLTDRRELLYKRINRRAAVMLETGLIEEVEGLLARGYSPDLKPLQAIGYRHAIDFLAGRFGYAETLELLARDTRRYAKRQLTWFGRDPEIHWFRPTEGGAILKTIRSYLGRKR